MRIVADQFEIFEFEIVNVLHRRVQLHRRQRPGFAGQLQPGLIDVIGVEMLIAERVHERAGIQSADLSDHQRQQRIARNVERHAQK